MPRLGEQELAAAVVRNRVAADYLVNHFSQASLDDVLPLVHAYREAVAALTELVALKTLRDTGGPTDDHERRHPLAWAAARRALE